MKADQLNIEHKISESGTTTVYRAFDVALHRTVLLKVLHKHLAHAADVRERFIREARSCAALRSEHIVQVYDLTEIDGTPAIVMEFVEGKSLKEIIDSGEQRTFEFTKKTALHVLRGLAVAHDKGIIHRDIKPGNILLSNEGILKVSDFGLASFAVSPTVTMEGVVLGTPAYMSPEQVQGDEVDSRTDLFALGVTLIEVLTGERIFEGSTYTECMMKVLAFREPLIDTFADYSSPDFVQFLKKLMHPNKAKRFASAYEALEALGEKKSNQFLPTPPIQARKQRMFILMTAGSVVVVLLILFGWIRLSEQRQSQSTDQHTGEQVVQQYVDSANTVQESLSNSFRNTNGQSVLSDEARNNKPSSVTTKDSGKVFFTSTPWAKVYLNNHLIGETPIAKPFILAAGSHTVMFTNPQFEPIVKTINVESNKELTVSGNFLDNVGYLMCTVIPWAEVYIDELYKDTTPLNKPIMLSSGKHTIRFKNSAFSDVVKEISVEPKDTVQLSITLTK
jgi:serine/threonine protein kinase